MKIENITYKCDRCGVRLNDIPFNDIRITTQESGFGPYDFCSIECFIKKFNQCMDEDGVGVSIRNDGGI